jgi:hypothetical protein
MRSAEWRELARKTQRAYEQNLAVIEAAFGDLPVALVTSARAKRLYEGCGPPRPRPAPWS